MKKLNRMSKKDRPFMPKMAVGIDNRLLLIDRVACKCLEIFFLKICSNLHGKELYPGADQETRRGC